MIIAVKISYNKVFYNTATYFCHANVLALKALSASLSIT